LTAGIKSRHTENPKDLQHSTDGFLYERNLLIFESNLEISDVFNPISVYPLLTNIPKLSGEKAQIKVGLRYIDSVRGLQHYTCFHEGMV